MGASRCAAQYNITTEKLTNYIQSNYKNGSDIAHALRLLQDMTFIMPPRPTGGTDANGNVLPPDNIEVHMFKRVYNQEYCRETKYQENKKKAYFLITEHCSPEVKAGLKALDVWDMMEMTQDSVLLLRRVKGLCCRFDATHNGRQGDHALFQSNKQRAHQVRTDGADAKYHGRDEAASEDDGKGEISCDADA